MIILITNSILFCEFFTLFHCIKHNINSIKDFFKIWLHIQIRVQIGSDGQTLLTFTHRIVYDIMPDEKLYSMLTKLKEISFGFLMNGKLKNDSLLGKIKDSVNFLFWWQFYDCKWAVYKETLRFVVNVSYDFWIC